MIVPEHRCLGEGKKPEISLGPVDFTIDSLIKKFLIISQRGNMSSNHLRLKTQNKNVIIK